MGQVVLVDKGIAEGQRLIDALKASNFPLDAALWRYKSEPEQWRLILATPVYDRQGQFNAIFEIISVFRQITPELKIDIEDISVVSAKDRLIQSLRELQRPGIDLSEMRLRDTPVYNGLLEDSYIYFINRC